MSDLSCLFLGLEGELFWLLIGMRWCVDIILG